MSLADSIRSGLSLLRGSHVPGPYVVYLHPDAVVSLMQSIALDRWKRAYRAYRIERHEGAANRDWPAHAIFSGYADAHPIIQGEVARFEGFQIKTTKWIKK